MDKSVILKYLGLVLGCLLLSSGLAENKTSHWSKVEELKNKDEVEAFVRSQSDSLSKFELKRIADFTRDKLGDAKAKILAEKFGIDQSYYETDFDSNGYTDLLVIGDSKHCRDEKGDCGFNSYVFMVFADNHIQTIDIVKTRRMMIVPVIEAGGSRPLLKIYRPAIMDQQEKGQDKLVDTLIYNFGDFIEYNENQVISYSIEKIVYSTRGCYGTCPIFRLEINMDDESYFLVQRYNFTQKYSVEDSDETEGEFKTTISADKQKRNHSVTKIY